MGIIMILAVVLFILPLVIGLYVVFRNKKAGLIILSVPFLVTIVMAGWWIYEANHHFVSSTSLESEQIDDLVLFDHVDKAFKEEHGEYEEQENVYYQELLEFDSFTVGTNKEQEITYILIEDNTLTTDKGIGIGSSLDEVIEVYGDSYYTYKEMGLDDSINYLDRENKILLQFWHDENEIVRIVLRKS